MINCILINERKDEDERTKYEKRKEEKIRNEKHLSELS